MYRKKVLFVFWFVLVGGLLLVIWTKPPVFGWEKEEFRLSPYPFGRTIALSFVDDTDYAVGPDIEPVYDLLDRLGFRTTKTVWMFDATRTSSFVQRGEREERSEDWGVSLENSEYLRFIKGLSSKGFEIALHGVSAGNDHRIDILRGYEKFRSIFGRYPKIETLHERNIENLYSGYHKLDLFALRIAEKLIYGSDYQGHVEGSEYFWGDICQKYVTYVRLPFHEIKEINLLNLIPGLIFHDPKRPYVKYWFPNADGADLRGFLNLTSKENLRKLVEQRGTCLIYTHFAKQFTRKRGEVYVLDDRFVERMGEISKLDGWFVTASEILDRFRMMKHVKLVPIKGGVCVVNTGSEEIKGVTILYRPLATLYDGFGNRCKTNSEGELVIDTVEGNSAFSYYVSNNAADGEVETFSISTWERMRVEIRNYLGAFLGM